MFPEATKLLCVFAEATDVSVETATGFGVIWGHVLAIDNFGVD